MKTNYSIAMCTFNGAQYIQQQLDSIEKQSVVPREVIVCDDCSTDNTVAIIRTNSKYYSYPVHIYNNISRLGFVKNFEKAISLCSSEFIFLSDQDDYWLPDRAQKYLNAFNENTNVVFVISNSIITSESLEKTTQTMWDIFHVSDRFVNLVNNSENSFPHYLKRHSFPGHQMAFKKSLLNVILPFPTNQHDFWISLVSSAVGQITMIPEPLTLYRKHQSQSSVGADGENFLALAKDSIPGHYFDSEIFKYTELLNRIERIDSIKFQQYTFVVRLIKSKIAYLIKRRNMKNEGLFRVLSIAKLLWGKDYHKMGRGFLTAGRDLLG